jgi:hypothetical protein
MLSALESIIDGPTTTPAMILLARLRLLSMTIWAADPDINDNRAIAMGNKEAMISCALE